MTGQVTFWILAVVAVASVASVALVPALGPDALRAEKLRPMIQKVAQETSMSPQLLHAVISVESGYDAKAVSRKGAQGLMQLMPKTALRSTASRCCANFFHRRSGS